MMDWRSDVAKLFSDIAEERRDIERSERCRNEEETRKAGLIAAQREVAEKYIRDTVEPLLQEIAAELQKHGRSVTSGKEGLTRWIESTFEGGESFRYEVIVEPQWNCVALSRRCPSDMRRADGGGFCPSQVRLYKTLRGANTEDLIGDFLKQYREHVWRTCLKRRSW